MSAAPPAVELERRVQNELLRRHVRLEEFFRTFDRHHLKRITVPQAVRALSNLGIKMIPNDERALRRYTDPSGQFKYDDFCADMNVALGELHELEKKPDASPQPLETTQEASLEVAEGGKPRLSEAEEAMVGSVLDALAAVADLKGVHWGNTFKDFDPQRCGLVSPSQFDRALSGAMPTLEQRERAALAKAYQYGRGPSARINYRELHRDVHERMSSTPEAEERAATMRRSHRSVSPLRSMAVAPGAGAGTDGHGGQVEGALEEILKQVAEKRVRLKDFFVDFDRHNTGLITEAQFMRVLRLMDFHDVSLADLEAVSRRYFDPARGKINYRDFLERVEEAFGFVPGLETHPSLDVATVQSRLVPARNSFPSPRPVDARDKPELKATVRSLRDRVRNRGIDLVNVFEDFDVAHEGHITPHQFLRALSALHLLPSSERAQNLLVQHFSGVGNRAHLVCWRTFKDSIDPSRTTDFGAEMAQLAQREREDRLSRRPAAPAGASAAAADPREVMRRLVAFVAERGVRVGEFLRGMDPLRHGSLTAAQLERGLSTAGFPVKAAEAKALARAYADESRGLDAANHPCINLEAFLGDVESAFVPRDLERDPDADPRVLTQSASSLARSLRGREAELGLTGGRSGRGGVQAAAAPRLTSEEAEQLRELLGQLHHKVDAERSELLPFFVEFDRAQHGTIPPSQFRRVVSMAGRALPMSPPAVELVCKAFASRGPDGKDDVHYRWFLESLGNPDDAVEELSGIPRDAALTFSGARRLHEQAERRQQTQSLRRTGLRSEREALRRAQLQATVGARPPSPVTFASALDHLQDECAARAVRLREFFDDHDPLHLGVCSQAKFRSALATAGVAAALREEELVALERGLRDSKFREKIRWKDLADSIDGGREELERHPTARMPPVTRTRHNDVDPSAAAAVDAGEAQAAAQAVARGVRDRGVDLKTRFRDFDRHNHGTLPAARFVSVLSDANIRVSPRQVQMLATLFRATEGADTVHWRRFLEHLEQLE